MMKRNIFKTKKLYKHILIKIIKQLADNLEY